jgi:hypothetical protein
VGLGGRRHVAHGVRRDARDGLMLRRQRRGARTPITTTPSSTSPTQCWPGS